MNNNYIGVFDSGIGGLTVVKEIEKLLPKENIVYLGDTKNMPYGNKTKAEIEKLVLNDVKFLATYNPKAIVIACNTSDALGSDNLYKHYNLPIIGIINVTATKASQTTINNKIAVFATVAAINSKAYQNALTNINPKIQVTAVACPSLATLVETGLFDSKQTRDDIKQYLKPVIENDCDTLILGCTHYPLLTDIIKQYHPNINIISSSHCAAMALKEELEKTDQLADKHLNNIYNVTANKQNFLSTANIFMKDIYEVNQI